MRYRTNAKGISYSDTIQVPARSESHDEGSTAANSLWGENQSRADRRRLRLGCASSVNVVCVGCTSSFSTRVCAGMCGAAGGMQRYGCGSGDAEVDAENTQFALVSGTDAVCRALPRAGEREEERLRGGDAERRGNARRMGFKKLDVRDFLSPRTWGEKGGRRGRGGGPEAMVGESFSGIERGEEEAVPNEKAGHGTDSRSGCDDDCAVVAVTVKNENAGVWPVELSA